MPNCSAWRGVCRAGRGLDFLALRTAALCCLLVLAGGGKGFEVMEDGGCESRSCMGGGARTETLV